MMYHISHEWKYQLFFSRPSSKRDIPVGNYRVHTAQCARRVANVAMAACQHCPARLPRAEMEAHYETAHAIKVCDQCGISVEAGKLHDHRVSRMMSNQVRAK